MLSIITVNGIDTANPPRGYASASRKFVLSNRTKTVSADNLQMIPCWAIMTILRKRLSTEAKVVLHGDYGYLDEDGYVHYRKKENVIVTKNGKNIFPEEVEFHLGRSDYILESLVYGVDGCGGKLWFMPRSPDYQAIEEDFGPLSEEDSQAHQRRGRQG